MALGIPAQIVFAEAKDSTVDRGVWVGQLLTRQNVVDVTHGPVPVTWKPWCRIEERGEGGRCLVVFQGESRHGRRYSWYENVTRAQAAAIRWASRRFRVIL